VTVIIIIFIIGIVSTLPHILWAAGGWDGFPGSQPVYEGALLCRFWAHTAQRFVTV